MKDAEPILVLGHTGLLGRAVVAACGGAALVVAGGRESFDLARAGRPLAPAGEGVVPGRAEAEGSLQWLTAHLAAYGRDAAAAHAGLDLMRRAILELEPAVVINCAGYTAVDQAEAEPELAWAVNAEGAEAVARACAQAGAHLVHLSTDYVFDGRERRPYREDDPPAPLSAYGRSKLAGEQRVRRVLPGALVVRSAWLFGPGRADFVDKVLARARQGRRVRVVADQLGSPTYTLDLARALVELGRRRVGGLLHVVNAGQASRYELARQAVRLAGLEVELVEPVSSREYVLPAARPAYSVLDSRRAARLLGGPLPTWWDALRRHLAGGGGEASA